MDFLLLGLLVAAIPFVLPIASWVSAGVRDGWSRSSPRRSMSRDGRSTGSQRSSRSFAVR